MKHLRIISALLALLLLLSLFAGCANNETAKTDSPKESTPTKAPVVATNNPDEKPEDSNDANDAEPEDDPHRLPIVGEKTTFTAYAAMSQLYVAYCTGYNDFIGYQVAEERTNIHIEWDQPSPASAKEAFSLLIASQDYPDFIEQFSPYYTAGLDKAVEDEICISLNDIIPKYIPNYVDLLEKNNAFNDVMTDSGLMAQLYMVNDKPQDPYSGWLVRQDWLDDLGITDMTTYDMWHDALVQFRDVKGATSPMLLSATNACDSAEGIFKAGYGTSSTFFHKNGKVYYGPLLPETKEWISMVANWYQEGLIDRDFATRTDLNVTSAMQYAGETGLWNGAVRNAATGTNAYDVGLTDDPNWYCGALVNPVRNKGERTHIRQTGELLKPGTVISTFCKDVPTLAKWFNYCYSEQGMLDLCYGREGESFYFDENGQPTLISQWFIDVTGVDNFSMTRHIVGPTTHAGYFITLKTADVPLRPKDQQIATDIVKSDLNDWAIPSFISPTADESSEFSAIMGDVQTYLDENVAKIIMGVNSVDSYDDVIVQLKKMGAERAVELKQIALDRYFTRGK